MLSPPVSREHFFWLCKAICRKSWNLSFQSVSNPHQRPFAVHYLAIGEKDEAVKATNFLWIEDRFAKVDGLIEKVINVSHDCKSKFSHLTIFTSASRHQFECDLPWPTVHFNPVSNDTIFIKLLDWDELSTQLKKHKELLRTYIQAGLKENPSGFIFLPDPTTRAVLDWIPRRLRKKKNMISRLSDEYHLRSSSAFSEHVTARFEQKIEAQYIKSNSHFISVKNVEQMGHCVCIHYETSKNASNKKRTQIDLWVLTNEASDVAPLLDKKLNHVFCPDILNFETLFWIQYVSGDKLKRKFARILHKDADVRQRDPRSVVDREKEHNVVFVHFATTEAASEDSEQLGFRTTFPPIAMMWEDLFPNDTRDDCHILAAIRKTSTHLFVEQIKFLYGLEICHVYGFSLNRISPAIAYSIQTKRTFSPAIPHGHIVTVDGSETYRRGDGEPRSYTEQDHHKNVLIERKCKFCGHIFFDFTSRAAKACAKCDINHPNLQLHFG